MNIEVRAADSDDMAELIASDPHAQIKPRRRAQISEWVAAGHCFVAERGARIVGYCVLTKHFFDSFFIELVAGR